MYFSCPTLSYSLVSSRYGFPHGSVWNIIYRGMARRKVEDCWKPVCGVMVRRIPNEDTREKCKVNSFLMENLFNDDPLMIAAGTNRNPPDPGLIQYYATAINQGRSLYAKVDMTQEIVGVCVAKVVGPSNPNYLFRQAKRLTYEESSNYMKVLAAAEDKANIYRKYDADKAWSIECLCTGRVYRRRGIAKLLLKQARELASREKDVQLLKLVSPNVYGSKAAIMCGGMKSVSARLPSEYKDDEGTTMIPTLMCPPHKEIEVFISSIHPKEKK